MVTNSLREQSLWHAAAAGVSLLQTNTMKQADCPDERKFSLVCNSDHITAKFKYWECRIELPRTTWFPCKNGSSHWSCLIYLFPFPILSVFSALFVPSLYQKWSWQVGLGFHGMHRDERKLNLAAGVRKAVIFWLTMIYQQMLTAMISRQLIIVILHSISNFYFRIYIEVSWLPTQYPQISLAINSRYLI